MLACWIVISRKLIIIYSAGELWCQIQTERHFLVIVNPICHSPILYYFVETSADAFCSRFSVLEGDEEVRLHGGVKNVMVKRRTIFSSEEDMDGDEED